MGAYDDLQAEVAALCRPREEDRLRVPCANCGQVINHACFYVQKVDAYGETLYGEYFCNSICMRRATAVVNKGYEDERRMEAWWQ